MWRWRDSGDWLCSNLSSVTIYHHLHPLSWFQDWRTQRPRAAPLISLSGLLLRCLVAAVTEVVRVVGGYP